jgi:hypothetical protein
MVDQTLLDAETIQIRVQADSLQYEKAIQSKLTSQSLTEALEALAYIISMSQKCSLAGRTTRYLLKTIDTDLFDKILNNNKPQKSVIHDWVDNSKLKGAVQKFYSVMNSTNFKDVVDDTIVQHVINKTEQALLSMSVEDDAE